MATSAKSPFLVAAAVAVVSEACLLALESRQNPVARFFSVVPLLRVHFW